MYQPAALLAAVLLTVSSQAVADDSNATSAAPRHVEKVFLVPASEGYGVGDCLISGQSECGQVVANAWCESQGFAIAASYGVAASDEYTGAIEHARVASDRPIRITCQD